jgi:hypothetical protein
MWFGAFRFFPFLGSYTYTGFLGLSSHFNLSKTPEADP